MFKELYCHTNRSPLKGESSIRKIAIIYDASTEECIDNIHKKKDVFVLETAVNPDYLIVGNYQFKQIIAYASRDTREVIIPGEIFGMEIIVLPIETYLEVSTKDPSTILSLMG